MTDKLMIGEHFTYAGIEWICLDIINDNYFAITAQIYDELPFDEDDRNDWKTSSLRDILNTKFLKKLKVEHLIKQSSDLTADNGDKSYGTSSDYVTILSCDQYRKYRDLVPLFEECMWTLTPWSCDAGYAGGVRIVNPTGTIGYYAYSTLGVAPACIFSSENLKLRRQAHLVGVDESEQ